MSILLTGGAGYIGSHTAVAMTEAGYDIIIADSLQNSHPAVIDRIGEITGRKPLFYKADAGDAEALRRVFEENEIEGAVHFAGLKAVGESLRRPLKYYRGNLNPALTLLEIMREYDVKKLVFSSSATVYGEENPYPYTETMKTGSCASPYGWTKFMIEQIFSDAAKADDSLSVVLLRYFNVIGAHPGGLIGEDPQEITYNLMPLISRAAAGRTGKLTVFGGDYDTPDGTCRRDYLHVMDLAEGHVKALRYADGRSGAEAFNLGTGEPYSVLEIIAAFEKAAGVRVPYEIGPRRDGDLPEFWADPSKAERILKWKASRSLGEMCRDSWNWQRKNPDGYRGGEEDPE